MSHRIFHWSQRDAVRGRFFRIQIRIQMSGGLVEMKRLARIFRHSDSEQSATAEEGFFGWFGIE